MRKPPRLSRNLPALLHVAGARDFPWSIDSRPGRISGDGRLEFTRNPAVTENIDAQRVYPVDMEMIYETYIKTTPEKLWTALTDPQQTAIYYFGNSYITDFVPGSAITTTNPNADGPLGEGTVVEVDRPAKLVVTFTGLWSESVHAEGESLVTYEIEQIEDSCHLTVTHGRLRAGANEQLYGGWPMILSGLKTWLETGERLTTPGSLMYT